MIERTATIASTVGLHARPAAIFAEAAAEYEDLEITIAAAGEPAKDAMDATSVLSLMGLGAAHRTSAAPVPRDRWSARHRMNR